MYLTSAQFDEDDFLSPSQDEMYSTSTLTKRGLGPSTSRGVAKPRGREVDSYLENRLKIRSPCTEGRSRPRRPRKYFPPLPGRQTPPFRFESRASVDRRPRGRPEKFYHVSQWGFQRFRPPTHVGRTHGRRNRQTTSYDTWIRSWLPWPPRSKAPCSLGGGREVYDWAIFWHFSRKFDPFNSYIFSDNGPTDF